MNWSAVVAIVLLATALGVGRAAADELVVPESDDFTFSTSVTSAGPAPAWADDPTAMTDGFTFTARLDHKTAGSIAIAGSIFSLQAPAENLSAIDAAEGYGIGLSYSIESWTLGLDWAHGRYDPVFINLDDGSGQEMIAFTSSYELGSNIRLNGVLGYSDDASGAAVGEDNLAVGIGTLINF
ncbi:MAG: hypothetical protein ACREE7_05605 [Dongiaceae bacterium]